MNKEHESPSLRILYLALIVGAVVAGTLAAIALIAILARFVLGR